MERKIMDNKIRYLKQGLLALTASAMLFGCSDGSDGVDGEDGVIGVNIDSATSVQARFTEATVTDGVVTVNFDLENANGVAVLGLNKDYDLRFGIAQLAKVNETVGDAEIDRGYQWQAYINELKEPGTPPDDTSDLNPSPQYQANVEAASNCEDCLVDNGDGSYSYTFQQNIANVTEPLAIVYGEDYTHRATLELKLPQATANAHHDWQPSTGATTDIQTRNVVSITACYTCHQPESLALHGGRRVALENCASCHTATSGDPESGNSVEYTYMIHAIHKGQDRETSTPDGMVPAPYKIVGYGGSVHDYGKVMYPQKPAADCSACHVEGEGAPANADLFKADLSNTACVSCHTEKPSQSHSSTNCVSCHNSTDTYRGTGSAEKRHGDVLKAYVEAEAMGVMFSNIGLDANGKLMFDVQIQDASGAAIGSEFIETGTRVIVAWDSDKDFPAYTDASYSNRRFKLEDGTYDAATKTFTIIATTFDMPSDATGKTFELWSTVEVCFNNGGYAVDEIKMTECSDSTRSVAVKEAPYHFVWSGTGMDDTMQAAMRRSIIDAAKCQSCHNQENYHYNNGYNCQTCHTSDKTTKSDDSYPGGMKPTSYAFKAHEADGHYLKYAGVQSGTVLKTDCSTCHTEDGIQLGRASDRVWRYGDTETGNDIWVSSDAGTCLSCHQKYLSDSGANHIVANGGILDGIDAEDVRTRSAEACSTCHNPEQLIEIHGN
ncbi:OmcA/MtrC family decaheme c-type cytochrome [Shewanella sp. 1CM18E]|uniref:OmcA/MtrC family decaheme c-type cytochrome n=1 Tax=Shewanella sp. 1CM18E TaxID=2929169 RepID=UPI0020C171CA|nr:OmcA/MtrC family decaheme c-type cytochrome [Shewanella sp. 1CM18E]MCK8044178.1 OmcA/MtrC family decaheme c-type cytochrome [Shewanella sp. 1CM18E]